MNRSARKPIVDKTRLTQAKLDMIFLNLVGQYFDAEYYGKFVHTLVEKSDGGERPLFAHDRWTDHDQFNVGLSCVNGHFLITIALAI